MPNFQTLKISTKQNRFGCTLLAGIRAGTTTNLQIVLNTPKIPAKLSHPKNPPIIPVTRNSGYPPWDKWKGSELLINLLLFFVLFCFFFPQTDNDPPHGFSQTFQLFQKDNNSYFVLNDMFRLSLHHGWTSNAQKYGGHFVYEQERQMWLLF